jgi:drug/metabolite transporter (DMT)-like permease
MLYLLFAMMCSVSVAHLLTLAEKRSIQIFGVFAVNYAVGSFIALQGCGWSLPLQYGPALPAIGVVMGVLFIGTFFLMTESIKRLGVIVPVSLMRLSAVIPTAGSMFVFAEAPTTLQIAGMLVAFLSLPFANRKKFEREDFARFLKGDIKWGLYLFLAFGVVEFLFKLQRELYPLANSSGFLAFIFPVAFLCAIAMAVAKSVRPSIPMVLIGAGIGVINYFSAWFIMKALAVLPGIVVYPLNAVGVIVLTTISSMIIWRERPAPRNYVFLLMAMLALAMLYR